MMRSVPEALVTLETDRPIRDRCYTVSELVVGRVAAAHVHEDPLRVVDGDDQRMIRRQPLLAYPSPGRWSEVRGTDAFPFPTGFQR